MEVIVTANSDRFQVMQGFISYFDDKPVGKIATIVNDTETLDPVL